MPSTASGSGLGVGQVRSEAAVDRQRSRTYGPRGKDSRFPV
jgi:hypothetical protein